MPVNLQAARGASRINNTLINIFAAALSAPSRNISLNYSRPAAQPAGRKRRGQGKRMATAGSDSDHFGLRTINGDVMSQRSGAFAGAGRLFSMDNKRRGAVINNVGIDHHFLYIAGGRNIEHWLHQDIFHD